MYSFNNRTYLIFGGTGSLGKVLVERLLKDGKYVIVFSRDEAKHHKLRLLYPKVKTIIGDVRNYESVLQAINDYCPVVIINCAALKQVPLCEEYPYEAVLTNIVGTQNITRAVKEHLRGVHESRLKVLSVSTDKACKPVNSYGMTKALQERIHLKANDYFDRAIFNCVRYGNVLDSTGSVIPVFKDRIKNKLPLQVTDKSMTRFLLSLNEAVDLIFQALKDDQGGKIFIPKVKSAYMFDLAEVMNEHYKSAFPVEFSGIRPGEKFDEILISEEETYRTQNLNDVYVIHDINSQIIFEDIEEEYSSGSKKCKMNKEQLKEFLLKHGVL